MAKNAKVENGDHVRDVVTNFTGYVTGIAEYLTGCRQCLVVPTADDKNNVPNSQWLDEDRLEITQTARVVLQPKISGPDKQPASQLGLRKL